VNIKTFDVDAGLGSPDTAAPAESNRRALREAQVLAISLVGGPGCGKTSLIDATVERLMPDVHVAVISGDPAPRRDADRGPRRDGQVVRVNTGEGGALDAGHVRDALARLDLSGLDLLFIENVGTLAIAAPPDLGQDLTVTVLSVAGGDDKAAKHPDLVRASDAVVLNKTDLLAAVPFDLPAFRGDVRRLNPGAELIELSSLRRDGVERWLDWLRRRVPERPRRLAAAGGAGVQVSNWFG
jgi:hydrogenase nickel incorporation protein HypB